MLVVLVLAVGHPPGSGLGRKPITDQLLRRSFHAAGQPAAFLVGAGLLIVRLQLNVPGSRPVLARGWHGWLLHFAAALACRSRINDRSRVRECYPPLLLSYLVHELRYAIN